MHLAESSSLVQPDDPCIMERLKRRTLDSLAPIIGAKAQSEHLNRAFSAAHSKIKDAVRRVDPESLGGRVSYTLVMSASVWEGHRGLKAVSSEDLKVCFTAACNWCLVHGVDTAS